MKTKIFLWLFIALILVSSVNAIDYNDYETYTPSSHTKCVDWVCTTSLGGVKYVYEDEVWKDRREARSFKRSAIGCNIDFDGRNVLECVDWNETSVTVKASITDSRWDLFKESIIGTAENVLLRKYKINDSEDKIYNSKFETTIPFEWYNKEKEYTFKFNPEDKLEFGEHSTILNLQEADTENLEDTMVQGTGLGSTNENANYGTSSGNGVGTSDVEYQHAYLKFNITSIPTGSIITKANLWIYAYSTAGSNIDIDVYRVSNQSWWEMYPTYNNVANDPTMSHMGNSDILDTKTNGAGGYNSWNVTDGLQIDVNAGNTNASYKLNGSWSIGAERKLSWRSKEIATLNQRPSLNITYSPPPNVAPFINLNFPKNNTYQGFNSINFTYNASDSNGDPINCSLFINTLLIDTDTSVTQIINQTFNRTSLSEGSINWTVGCYDGTEWGNSTTYNYSLIFDSPVVTNVYPSNNTQRYSPNVNFTYNVTTETHSISSCSLFLNNVLNTTDNSITEDINQTFNFTTLPYGDSFWIVQCESSEGYFSNSTEWNFSRLRNYPLTQNVYPKEGDLITTPYINITYNVSIDSSSNTISSCSLWLNDELDSTDTSITTGINQTFNLTFGGTQHRYNYTIECITDANIKDNSTLTNFTFNQAPTTPSTSSPANATITVLNSDLLTCSGSTDSDGDTVNYEFWTGNTTTSLFLAQNSTSTTYNYTFTEPKHYYWNCKANDNLSQSSFKGVTKLTYAQLYANCSASNTTSIISLNFSFAEETNSTQLFNVTYEASFNVRGNDTTENLLVTFPSNLIKDEIKYCLSPKNDTNLFVTATAEYSKTNYDTRTFILDTRNKITTQQNNITLFLTLTSLTSDIDITVTDAEDRPVSAVVVEAEAYDVGTDTYSLVQVETTDSDGRSQMKLILGNFYRFKFYLSGVLVDTTDKFKLVSTDLTFKITTSQQPLKPTVQIPTMLTNLSYVKSSGNFSMNFSRADNVAGLTEVCWVINNLTMENISSLTSNCFTGNTGQDSFILIANTGIFRGYIYVFIDGIKYVINQLEIDLRTPPAWGGEGLVLGLFLVLTLGGLGAATKNPSVVIVMVLLGVIINALTNLWMLGWFALSSIIIVGFILLGINKT